jgi:hypothetical protein
MNIFKLLFELFVIYLLYKVVFDFIIPIYHASKQMKGKVNEMHQRMQQQGPPPKHDGPKPTPNKDFSKDYIEYEEVK